LQQADPDDWMTPELHSRIQPGMTLTEVEQLLGCPPGDYCATARIHVAARAGPNRNWGSRRWVVFVRFDQSGKVIDSSLVDRRTLSAQKQPLGEGAAGRRGF